MHALALIYVTLLCCPLGKKQLLFPASPAETSPSLSMIDKKPLQQQKTAPVLNPSPLSLSGIENPVQPQTSTPVATFAKVSGSVL